MHNLVGSHINRPTNFTPEISKDQKRLNSIPASQLVGTLKQWLGPIGLFYFYSFLFTLSNPNPNPCSNPSANLLVLAGGYDSLPRRSGLHRHASGGSGGGSGSNSCVGSCAKVVSECEKKVKLLEEILRLQDEALQAGKQQKALAAAKLANSAAASPSGPPAKSAAGVSVPWLFPSTKKYFSTYFFVGSKWERNENCMTGTKPELFTDLRSFLFPISETQNRLSRCWIQKNRSAQLFLLN